MVVMVDMAIAAMHLGFALSAGATPAQIGCVNAIGLHRFQQRLIWCHGNGLARGGKLHFMNQADGANYLAVKLFTR